MDGLVKEKRMGFLSVPREWIKWNISDVDSQEFIIMK